MKRLLTDILAAATLVLSTGPVTAQGRNLAMVIEPRFGTQPLVFDALANRTPSGQVISVTRLDLLLSNIALRRADGGWLGLTNWFAYLSPREGRSGFELNNLPAGSYDRVRFNVGLTPEINHRDPAQYPPAHPLHPDVNGLHWGWMGGYVFLALEGHWKDPTPSAAGERRSAPGESGESGFSFHVATDRELMTVELPLALDLSADRELRLVLHVDQILARPNLITITEATSSTHSRTNDTLADQLRQNIERAFAFVSLSPAEVSGTGVSPVRTETHGRDARATTSVPNAPLIASNATPYSLTISRFFPRPALPLDNPLTEEGVALGRTLFFDPRLSINNSQSCASCHQPAAAFTDGKSVSIGAEGQAGTRSAMPLFNLAWKSSFFWDGRAPTLREQVLMPIQNPIEMHEALTNVVAKLTATRNASAGRPLTPALSPSAGERENRSPSPSEPETTGSTAATGSISGVPQLFPLPRRGGEGLGEGAGNERELATNKDYPSLFTGAFGSPEVTPDRLARALEQFLLIQVSHDSKFDRVLAGEEQLTPEERRGFELFHTEYDPRRRQFGADCFHCHGGPLFQSQSFANNGLDVEPRDLGRSLVTGKPGDRGKFAVPSLRNVALTAPYMHDGRFKTLEEVVEHYSTGVKRSPTLDPNLAKHPIGGVPLSAADKLALVAFLTTLTDREILLASVSEAR